ILRNIGRVYTLTRDYARAQEYLQNSLDLSRKLSDVRAEHDALLVLAGLVNARANYERALTYEEQVLKLDSPALPVSAKIKLRNHILVTHYELGNLEKSAEATLQTLELARSAKVPAAEATALGNLAMVQAKQGKMKEALE